MFGATAILALSCGAATSQTLGDSQVDNFQLQNGDMFAGQTLDVVTVDDAVTAVTAAQGNGFGGMAAGDANVTSYQELGGAVGAHGVVNVGSNMGAVGTITTAATGNTNSEAASGATLTAVTTQVTRPVGISAVGQLEAAEANVGDLTESTQAVANSQDYLLNNGALGARASQWNESDVIADGGAIIGAASGQVTVMANAAGNNLSTVGGNQSSQRLIASQSNTGEKVQASKFTTYGESYLSSTAAMATGNNVSATNEGPLLDVTTNQTNAAYIRGQAEGTSASYSSSDVSAYAAGNATVVGNYGAELVLDNTQFNTGGGVEAVALSDLGSGWDSSASATAYGNSATGYVCSSCSGKMTVNNNQTNDVDVAATTTARTQYGRSVTGISTAVGNNASFYVSAPSSGSAGQH